MPDVSVDGLAGVSAQTKQLKVDFAILIGTAHSMMEDPFHCCFNPTHFIWYLL